MKETLQVLNQMVTDGVISDYAIGGAVAAIFYTEPTDTVDLDVMVAFAEDSRLIGLEPITRYLAARGYSQFQDEGILNEGLPVQFLPTASSLTVEAHREALTVTLYGLPARIIDPEHLMAIMLEVGRPKDYLRLAMCREQADHDAERFLDILTRHGLRSKWNAYLARTGQ